ncbi:Lrp/AsnC family transcriptional regulator [Streptomyces sp. NPDC006289]|uniref:Lrp/AsnC family transcriptional regulator n=1 Tax=Streptomyces sp. NPDC006289 TaxID=3156744 RepID=UPI0033AB85C5
MTPESPITLDALDHAVLRALHRAPRAPFAEVASAAGVHERTVARRLDRMTASGDVRFTAALVPEFGGEGLTAEVAVRCAPGKLHETALLLARRPDVHSVEVATGPLHVFAEVRVPDHQRLLTVVDSEIGRLDGVVDIDTAVVLRLLLTANDWAPYDDKPSAVRSLVAAGLPLPEPLAVDDLDRQLVALLGRDARMSTTRLARELLVGETTARRRLARLMTSHVLHLRLHAEPRVLGFPVEARFRIGVPYHLSGPVVRRLAAEPAVRQLSITTGATSILGYSSHRSTRDLHDFTTGLFAGSESGTSVEWALLMRSYKRAGITDRSQAQGRGR